MSLETIATPHYKIVCDNCAEALGSDDYGWILFESPMDALRDAQAIGWRVNGDVLTCPVCLDEESLRVVASPRGGETA